MSYVQQLVAERYRLTSIIGSGGMGRVWLARDEVLHREVAIKEVVLPDDMTFAERNELCQRTLREARAAGRLSHPNVVAVYDVVQAEGRPWIVMELVRSRSLYQAVRENGPVSPRRAAEIGLAVLAALRAAHKAGVWHRDVKPGNVLLADDGRVVLTDFGLATFEGDGTVTRSGVILGSAQYIAPERARDGASGPESDMWSLGATLYAAVEGRSPYARDTPMATLTALATAPPDTPRRAGPLRPVLIGLLRKNPRHRMRAAEVERLLARIVAGDRGRRSILTPRQRTNGHVGEEPVSAEVAFADGGAALLSVYASAVQSPAAPVLTPADQEPAEAAGGESIVGMSGAGPGGRLEAGPASVSPGGGDPPSGSRGRLGRDRMHTRTEETFRHVLPRRLWPLVVGALAVAIALAVPTLAYVRANRAGDRAGTSPSAPPVAATTTAPVLTAAMGVQACREQTADREQPVPVGTGDAIASFTPCHDPAADFTMDVPRQWGLSRVGPMLCLRDPTSLKAIGVLDLGSREGTPIQLVDDTTAWQDAAHLTNFNRLGVRDMYLPEGGAVLEYTYDRGAIRMHGQNYMMRLDGRLFVVSLLTADSTWLVDREYLIVSESSFLYPP